MVAVMGCPGGLPPEPKKNPASKCCTAGEALHVHAVLKGGMKLKPSGTI
jgi:hypothetical protein